MSSRSSNLCGYNLRVIIINSKMIKIHFLLLCWYQPKGRRENVGHISFPGLMYGINFIRIASRTNTQAFPLFIPPKYCLKISRTICNRRRMWRKLQHVSHLSKHSPHSQWYLVLWSPQRNVSGEYNAAPSRSLAHNSNQITQVFTKTDLFSKIEMLLNSRIPFWQHLLRNICMYGTLKRT
jgi:hypothetical protein